MKRCYQNIILLLLVQFIIGDYIRLTGQGENDSLKYITWTKEKDGLALYYQNGHVPQMLSVKYGPSFRVITSDVKEFKDQKLQVCTIAYKHDPLVRVEFFRHDGFYHIKLFYTDGDLDIIYNNNGIAPDRNFAQQSKLARHFHDARGLTVAYYTYLPLYGKGGTTLILQSHRTALKFGTLDYGHVLKRNEIKELLVRVVGPEDVVIKNLSDLTIEEIDDYHSHLITNKNEDNPAEVATFVAFLHGIDYRKERSLEKLNDGTIDKTIVGVLEHMTSIGQQRYLKKSSLVRVTPDPRETAITSRLNALDAEELADNSKHEEIQKEKVELIKELEKLWEEEDASKVKIQLQHQDIEKHRQRSFQLDNQSKLGNLTHDLREISKEHIAGLPIGFSNKDYLKSLDIKPDYDELNIGKEVLRPYICSIKIQFTKDDIRELNVELYLTKHEAIYAQNVAAILDTYNKESSGRRRKRRLLKQH
jgi:hypothetical protein